MKQKKQLSSQLNRILETSLDPRLDDAFDKLPYVATEKPDKKAKGKTKAKTP